MKKWTQVNLCYKKFRGKVNATEGNFVALDTEAKFRKTTRAFSFSQDEPGLSYIIRHARPSLLDQV
jgi:hypothetical protein